MATIETFTPPYPPTESTDKPELKLLEADFGDGYSQSGGDGLNFVRKIVSLNWDGLTPDKAQELEDFFEGHADGRPFRYTLSDTTKVRKWTCKEFSRKRGTPNTFEATIRQSFMLV